MLSPQFGVTALDYAKSSGDQAMVEYLSTVGELFVIELWSSSVSTCTLSVHHHTCQYLCGIHIHVLTSTWYLHSTGRVV